MAIALLAGTFSGTGASDSVVLRGWFNLSLTDFGVATIAVQRSFDNGVTWLDVESFTSNTQRRGYEPESGVLYRLNCTSYTSGTIVVRVSK